MQRQRDAIEHPARDNFLRTGCVYKGMRFRQRVTRLSHQPYRRRLIDSSHDSFVAYPVITRSTSSPRKIVAFIQRRRRTPRDDDDKDNDDVSLLARVHTKPLDDETLDTWYESLCDLRA